jgi:hypothetical protein
MCLGWARRRAAKRAAQHIERLKRRIALGNRLRPFDRQDHRQAAILLDKIGVNAAHQRAGRRANGQDGINHAADQGAAHIGGAHRHCHRLGGIDAIATKDEVQQRKVEAAAAHQTDALASQIGNGGDGFAGRGHQQQGIAVQDRDRCGVGRHIAVAAHDGEIGLAGTQQFCTGNRAIGGDQPQPDGMFFARKRLQDRDDDLGILAPDRTNGDAQHCWRGKGVDKQCAQADTAEHNRHHQKYHRPFHDRPCVCPQRTPSAPVLVHDGPHENHQT